MLISYFHPIYIPLSPKKKSPKKNHIVPNQFESMNDTKICSLVFSEPEKGHF